MIMNLRVSDIFAT